MLGSCHRTSCHSTAKASCCTLARRPAGCTVRACAGCMLLYSYNNKVVRVAGGIVPRGPLGDSFPDGYPGRFYEAASGRRLPNDATFDQEFRSALDKLLLPSAGPHGPADLEEFRGTGTCNGREHEWVLLSFPPDTVFPVHAHPGLEVIHLLAGTMHEVRLRERPPGFRPVVGQDGPDISGPGCSFTEAAFPPGSWIVNEVGSIHQSFSREEAVTLIAVWPRGYVFFPPEHLPPATFLPVNHDISREVRWKV